MFPEVTLLVDDDDMVRTSIKRLIQSAGCTVLEARDGLEALQLVYKFRNEITVILTDVSMPAMSGVALANAVAEFDPEMPIILMSGLPEAKWPDQPRCSWAVLLKPVTRDVLFEALRSSHRPPTRSAGGSGCAA